MALSKKMKRKMGIIPPSKEPTRPHPTHCEGCDELKGDYQWTNIEADVWRWLCDACRYKDPDVGEIK